MALKLIQEQFKKTGEVTGNLIKNEIKRHFEVK